MKSVQFRNSQALVTAALKRMSKTSGIKTRNRFQFATLLLGITSMFSADGSEPLGIVGKNDWLFLRSEIANQSEAKSKAETIALTGRLNRVFAANGIQMVLTMVPTKMRLYAEHLPDNLKISEYMATNYESTAKALKDSGVAVVDLHTPLMKSPLKDSEPYLFYRLDGHWNFVGAKLAADSIKTELETNPVLKKALDTTPEVSFQRSVEKRKRPSKAVDLLSLVPPNSGTFAPENVTWVRVIPTNGQAEKSLQTAGIVIQGSSFSQEWTGFVDSLRFVFQREILNVSVPAHIGSWVGMENYLSSDDFQKNKPKVLIWERPEYTMRAPPDFQYQEPRYKSNNTEWLLRTSAWIHATCKPSVNFVKVMPLSSGIRGNISTDGDVSAKDTDNGDFIEFSFEKPIQKLDYLAAMVTAHGTKALILEASGPGETTRKFSVNVVGDNAEHAFRAALPSNSRGYTKLRVFPGKVGSLNVRGLKVCRQPDDLLS